MGETEDFNTLAFEKRLMQLKDTQESIQSLSSWCLKQREHHKKVVSSWLNVLKRVKVEQRLVLFYLANDVIQYSKRKNYEFVESWGLNLQKATPLVRDDKVRPKILRIFKIWEQRSVYDDEFLSDLTGLLSAGAVKKTDDDPLDFQPQQLVNKIKQCTVLEADTDLRLKYIHESHLQLSDADALRASLKDKSNKDDVEKELNEGIACVERYTAALQREIVAREALLALLTSADQYYSTQRQEVKVVAYAYKNFGARVRALKRKLDELIPTLPNAAPSPPQRDEDVPSPGPDEDLELPTNADNGEHEDIAYNIDRTFNSTVTADGSLYNFGLTSFLSSDNPMSIFNDSSDILNSANKIEVINSRPNEKQGFDINEVLKPYMSNDSTNNVTDNSSVNSTSISQKSQDALPGLDLLTPESTGNPPPVSFYGTIDITDDTDEPYVPEVTSPWVNNWTIPRLMDTPESPPPVVVTTAPPEPRVYSAVQEVAPSHAADIDQRGILPPPPPPPALPLLGNIEDVDHRLLPNLPPPPPVPAPIRHPVQQDVDHRNLISLTHQPAPAPLPVPAPRLMNPINLDQDYRVPPMVPPPDIVESVDMDLSEDEEQQGMYPNQKEPTRRHSFNNNKVLVGGDNGKTNHNNLIPIKENKEPLSAPAAMPPLVNPFDSMPPNLKDFNLPNIPFNKTPPPNFNQNPPPNFSQKPPPNFNSTPPPNFNSNPPNPNFNSNPPNPNFNFEEDEDNSFVEDPRRHDNENSNFDGDWDPRGFTNQRFPRNWAPRTNFRPPGFGPQQWPRGGPRPPNRWMGPRQRFW